MSLSGLALDIGASTKGIEDDDVVDVITFAESSWGLNQKLYPVQRIILKCHYGLALDDNPWGLDLSQPVPLDHPHYDEITAQTGSEKGFYKYRVRISDWKRENWRVMSEADYIRTAYAEGRCNIQEVVPGEERREMILAVGRRSGKCVRGDTLVLTDRGVFPISELGDPQGAEFQPLDVEVAQEGPGKRARSAYFYNGGVKRTVKFATRCGFELEGTPNHRVKVLSTEGRIEWRYLGDLRSGDVICIHRTSEHWAQAYLDVREHHSSRGLSKVQLPKTLTEDWGLLLGYLVGDGTWSTQTGVELTVGDEESWGHSKTLFERLFGGWKQYQDKRRPGTGTLRFHNTGLREFLHNIGWEFGLGRDNKCVPWSVMRSPRSVVQAFLRGLFETDGGVEKGGKTVSFSTSSERLGREIQTLLLNLGIVAARKPKVIEGKTYWVLVIRGLRSRIRFAQEVGFVSSRKMSPLLASIESAGREGGDAESVPHQRSLTRALLEAVPKARAGGGWSKSAFRQALGNTIKPNSDDQLTYPRIQRVLAVAQEQGVESPILEHFRHLSEQGYFFDPVTSLEEGECPVFDLNVPENHEFVANGMTNHNTQMAAVISAYETYKLIKKGDPQKYYGLPVGERIEMKAIATDKNQAGILYAKVSGYYKECPFFTQYMANNTMSYARFQTPMDIQRYGRYADDEKANATLNITFAPCRAKGLRGAGNIVIIMDELAHFNDAGQSDAKEVYDAVAPSISAFSPKDPNDLSTPRDPKNPHLPPEEVAVEGRIISISSPLGKQGQFYTLYQLAMSGGKAAGTMFALQAPTWEVNPTVPASEFEKHYLKDANVFFTEYGGQFTDRTRGWITNKEDLLVCVDENLRPKSRGLPRVSHFVGLDFALAGDGTAIAIGHVEDGGIVELDYLEWIKAGEGQFENYERLDFDEVADWVYDLSKKFYFASGLFDQWSGIVFEQALKKRGLSQLVSTHFTKQLSSQMFQNFKDMMFDERLRLFDWPKPTDTEGGKKMHSPHIQELLELQAETQTKYITTVEAPQGQGKHDDMSDALVRMVWAASQNIGKNPYLAGSRAKQQGRGGMSPQAARQAFLKAKRVGGSSPDRQPSRLNRGRVRGR